jgi:hypothetical protein
MNPNNTEMQYVLRTPLDVRVYQPKLKVSFHTKEKCYHAYGGETNQYGEVLNPMNQVLSIMTNKTLESPAGSFTISLAGSQWRTYLTTNDIVVIEMGYIGEVTTTVMVGLIDSISVRRSVGENGEPTVQTTISGRDFGKLFVKDLLKFYPAIGGKTSSASHFLTEVGWIEMMKVFTADSIMKGTPAVLIDNIMRYIFMKYHDTEWTVYNEMGGGRKGKQTIQAGQIIRYQLGKINFFLPFLFSADQYEGSLWNMLERASIKPFTELWIDVRSPNEAWNPSEVGRAVPHEVEESSSVEKGNLPKGKGFYPGTSFQFGEDGAKVVLCLRETPYSSALRSRLVSHRIDADECHYEDLTKSDGEHYNLFWAGTTVNPLGIDLKKACPPLINESHVKRYGLSPLEVDIEGLEILESEKNKHGKTLETMTKAYTAKLKAWYENNHNYWSGTLEIRGNANIRVGHRVVYRSPSFTKEFYVEGVSHSFNVFEGWTTTLQVTRGMELNELVN